MSTRVLSPRLAVAWAAFFNFIAFLVFGTHVATTIAKDVVVQDVLVDRRDLRRAGRRHRLGPHHLLPRPADELVARAGRRHGRRRGGQGRASTCSSSEGLRKIGVFIVLSPLIGLALGPDPHDRDPVGCSTA